MYASAFAATLRGSRLYGSLVKGSRIVKFMTNVLAERKGSRYAVAGSGINFMSDSWIDWKPRIDEPSNIRPSSKAPVPNELAGTLKCCMIPGRSTNRTSMNSTPLSWTNFRTSSALLNISTSCTCVHRLARRPCAAGLRQKLGTGRVQPVSQLFREC